MYSLSGYCPFSYRCKCIRVAHRQSQWYQIWTESHKTLKHNEAHEATQTHNPSVGQNFKECETLKNKKRALPKPCYCCIVKQAVKQKWPFQTFQYRVRDNYFTHHSIWKKGCWTEERNCILQCIWFIWQCQFFNASSFYPSRTFEAFPAINTNVRERRRTAYRRWLWLPQIRFCFQIQSLRLTVHSVSFDSAVIVRYDEYITDDVSRMPRDFLTQQLRV